MDSHGAWPALAYNCSCLMIDRGRRGKLFDEAGVITPPYPFTVDPCCDWCCGATG
jgi:hypothetical protein